MKTSIYIQFVDGPAKSKTLTWIVKNLGEVILGEVKWYAAWRKYAFFPAVGTCFDPDCLYTIAEFCERKSKEHFGESISKTERVSSTPSVSEGAS